MNKNGYVLDISIDHSVITNKQSMPPGCWRLTYIKESEREISAESQENIAFLSLQINENTYKNVDISKIVGAGVLTSTMKYAIMKIISVVKNNREINHSDIWIKSYIQLLLSQCTAGESSMPTLLISELQAIDRVIQNIQPNDSKFPLPVALVQQSGVTKSKFQKGCLMLYGQSAQKLLQSLKMNYAFELLRNHKSINEVSAQLGFAHSGNFITAFHKHFSLTPKETRQLLNN